MPPNLAAGFVKQLVFMSSVKVYLRLKLPFTPSEKCLDYSTQRKQK